jgi:hypothetical protein
VGRHDNFFALGGHSLLAVQVIMRLQQALGVEAAISDLFARPALVDFARGLEGAALSRLPSISRAERGEGLPLSYAQQRLWFLAQMEGVSEAYHMPFGMRLKGELDRGALRSALDRVVARHEALRTTFIMVDGEAVQRILSVEESGFQLLEHDLREQIDCAGSRGPLRSQNGSADSRAAPAAGGRRAHAADHHAPHCFRRVVDGGVDQGVERFVWSF